MPIQLFCSLCFTFWTTLFLDWWDSKSSTKGKRSRIIYIIFKPLWTDLLAFNTVPKKNCKPHNQSNLHFWPSNCWKTLLFRTSRWILQQLLQKRLDPNMLLLGVLSHQKVTCKTLWIRLFFPILFVNHRLIYYHQTPNLIVSIIVRKEPSCVHLFNPNQSACCGFPPHAARENKKNWHFPNYSEKTDSSHFASPPVSWILVFQTSLRKQWKGFNFHSFLEQMDVFQCMFQPPCHWRHLIFVQPLDHGSDGLLSIFIFCCPNSTLITYKTIPRFLRAIWYSSLDVPLGTFIPVTTYCTTAGTRQIHLSSHEWIWKHPEQVWNAYWKKAYRYPGLRRLRKRLGYS